MTNYINLDTENILHYDSNVQSMELVENGIKSYGMPYFKREFKTQKAMLDFVNDTNTDNNFDKALDDTKAQAQALSLAQLAEIMAIPKQAIDQLGTVENLHNKASFHENVQLANFGRGKNVLYIFWLYYLNYNTETPVELKNNKDMFYFYSSYYFTVFDKNPQPNARICFTRKTIDWLDSINNSVGTDHAIKLQTKNRKLSNVYQAKTDPNKFDIVLDIETKDFTKNSSQALLKGISDVQSVVSELIDYLKANGNY